MEFHPRSPDECAGLLVFGYDYAWIGLKSGVDGAALVLAQRRDAAQDAPQEEQFILPCGPGPVWLRLTVHPGGHYRFSFSHDGENFQETGRDFTANCGHWVGAKVGLFASGPSGTASRGQADFHWFRVEPAGTGPVR